MATRATPDDVRLILDTDLNDAQLQAFIDAANAIINSTIADAPCHTEETLKQVEIFLSAHLATASTPQVNEETIGKSSEKRRDSDANYLDTAYALDCSGRLRESTKQQIQPIIGGGAGDFQSFNGWWL
jgi:hypothetical protein